MWMSMFDTNLLNLLLVGIFQGTINLLKGFTKGKVEYKLLFVWMSPVSVITSSGHYKCSEVLYLVLVNCQISGEKKLVTLSFSRHPIHFNMMHTTHFPVLIIWVVSSTFSSSSFKFYVWWKLDNAECIDGGMCRVCWREVASSRTARA